MGVGFEPSIPDPSPPVTPVAVSSAMDRAVCEEPFTNFEAVRCDSQHTICPVSDAGSRIIPERVPPSTVRPTTRDLAAGARGEQRGASGHGHSGWKSPAGRRASGGRASGGNGAAGV